MYVEHVGSSVDRPLRDLRGYRRLTLDPGETRTVQLTLPISSLSYWNEATHQWVVEPEEIRIRLGGSSADLPVDHTIRVTG